MGITITTTKSKHDFDKELIKKAIRFLEIRENVLRSYGEELCWEERGPFLGVMGYLRVVNGGRSMWRVSFGLFGKTEIPAIDEYGNWEEGNNVISFEFVLGDLNFWNMSMQIDTLLQRVMKTTMLKSLKK